METYWQKAHEGDYTYEDDDYYNGGDEDSGIAFNQNDSGTQNITLPYSNLDFEDDVLNEYLGVSSFCSAERSPSESGWQRI